jgi:hypothetical protein
MDNNRGQTNIARHIARHIARPIASKSALNPDGFRTAIGR